MFAIFKYGDEEKVNTEVLQNLVRFDYCDLDDDDPGEY
jgi:hypothetical protein